MTKKNDIVQGVIIAGGILAISLALTAAQRAHWIDADMTLRISMVVTGLVLVFYANAVPKAVFRSQRAHNVQRFTGWVFFATGLAYAAIWAFAPMPIALNAMYVIAAGFVAVVAYCIWSRANPPTAA